MVSDSENSRKRRTKSRAQADDSRDLSSGPITDVDTDYMDDYADDSRRYPSSAVRRDLNPSTNAARMTGSHPMVPVANRRTNSTADFTMQTQQTTRQNQLVRSTQTAPTRPARQPRLASPTTQTPRLERSGNKSRTITIDHQKPLLPPVASRRRVHWLLPAGIGMIAMLVLWVLAGSVLNWFNDRVNDYRYGFPRTYHTDMVVGHNNDSVKKKSHFIAMNYNHQAIVIELMAGDPGKSVTYVSPVYISGDEGQSPVTVEFKDVNNDKLLDMVMYIHLKNDNQVTVFINDGNRFRPTNNNDKIKL